MIHASGDRCCAYSGRERGCADSSSNQLLKLRESQNIFSRIVVGSVLILAGIIGHYALIFKLPKPEDIFDVIGYAFFIILYGVIANLFLLLGLKYYFGPTSWFKKHVANSIRRLFMVSLIIAVLIGLLFLIIVVVS